MTVSRPAHQRILLKLSGEALMGDDAFGINRATIVRMVLVPSTMQLLGARNWWIPRWLDRVLPHLNVEGHRDPAPIADPA